MILTEWNTEDAIAFAREEGKDEGKTEVARNLFSMGMTIEDIAKAVQLPIEELYALAL